ncbi:MAG: hypothetical protein IKR04_03015 [Clostridia bacterium]|nr:hypothetical protein [Clostridia bacterium]
MFLKSNKGYSLVEIGVGIIILTIFLIVSLGMFNGAYNNYRRLKQRNSAVNTAVIQIENMLQTDANELTGFLTRELDTSTNRYVLKPCAKLVAHVSSHFDTDDVEKYIEDHTSECINSYIKEAIQNNHPTAEQLANGEYGFIVNGLDSNVNMIDIFNGQVMPSGAEPEYVISNNQALRIIKTVRRLSAEDGVAYGNEVLKLRVEVFYSAKFGNDISEDDMESIVLETIKVTNTAD